MPTDSVVSRRPPPAAATPRTQGTAPASQANAVQPPPAPKQDAHDAQAQAAAPVRAEPAKSLTSQVKDKLVSFLFDEVSKPHSIDLAKVNLGSNGALGVRANEQILGRMLSPP